MAKFHFVRSLTSLHKKIGVKGIVVERGSFGFGVSACEERKSFDKKKPREPPRGLNQTPSNQHIHFPMAWEGITILKPIT